MASTAAAMPIGVEMHRPQQLEGYSAVAGEPAAPFLRHAEGARRPRRWIAALSVLLLCGGACAAYSTAVFQGERRIRGTSVLQAKLGEVIRDDLVEARLPPSSCFSSATEWEPLGMPGQDRHDRSSLEECQALCRATSGCAKITYWPDGGCYLADRHAKQKPGDRDAVAGPATCDDDSTCFKNGARFEPLDMVGRGREYKETAQACQAYCQGMPHCTSFAWWPDGGCHVQDKDARAVKDSSNVVSGPALCPLLATTTVTATATTTSSKATRTSTSTTLASTSTTPAPTTTTDAPSTSTTPSPTTTTPPTTTTAASSTTTIRLTSTASGPTSSSRATESTTTSPPTTTTPKSISTTPASTTKATAPAPSSTEKETTTEVQTSTVPPTTTTIPSEGCELGVPLLLTSHRWQQLKDDHGSLKSGDNKQLLEQWILSDAGDGYYFITSHRKKQLSHENGHVSLKSGKTDAQRWGISDAGLGSMFIQAKNGDFLQDHRGDMKLTPNADDWEKWRISAVDATRACRYHTLKLFCFTVMRSLGPELAMVRKQQELGAGIFGCEAALVLSDTEKDLGGYHKTSVISSELLSHRRGMYKNSGLFLDVWESVKADGRYKDADWTIKVDPVTVFLPDRLRARMGGKMHAKTYPTFFANCAAKVDVQAKEHPHFMYGPLEVFSRAAVGKLFGGFDRCKKEVPQVNTVEEEPTCSKDGASCKDTKCCTNPGSSCYKKDDEWASCNQTCNERMLWNPDKQEFEEQDAKVWDCNKLSCTASGENCMTSKCCLEPGMTCFKKNDEWASCNATCNEKMLWNHDKQVFEEQDHKVWDCTALSETPKVVLGEKMWEERYLTHCLELLDVKMNTHMSLKLLSDPHCDNTGHVPDCTGTTVAFNNFSSVEAYTECWSTARGRETSGSVSNELDVKK